MKFVVLLLLLPLTACTTADTSGISSLITTLSKDHCTSQLSYSAAIGALNPGSGLQISGQINCPAVAPAGMSMVSTTAPTVAFQASPVAAQSLPHDSVPASPPVLSTPPMEWTPTH